jgi:hypothetical protein
MSIQNRILVTIGLSLAGSLVWARAQDAADGSRPLAPASAPDATAPSAQEQFLLLTTGQLIQGIVTRQGTDYLVRQRVGVMTFSKRRVEGAFKSVREAYKYRAEQLPDRDYDERFKLALWCLHHQLIAEAKEQLTEVVEHNPNHTQAQAMLVSIGQAATRAALRQLDPNVRQTRADEMAEARPGSLDSAVLRRAARELGISNLPVIFDLPAPLAVKRADEFARYINPLLQTNCAKCHNGEYDGAFQLVVMKNRADRTPEALRANLDATLRLIDPKNPSRSELLSSTLRPHGRGPRPRPIFPGSNDPTYSILSAWVHNLTPPKVADDAIRAERGRPRTDGLEAFAGDRNQIGRERADGDEQPPAGRYARSEPAAGMAAETRIPPPTRLVPVGGFGAEISNSGDPKEFPLPFAVTGVKPNLGPATNGPKPPTPSSRPANGASTSPPAAAADPAKPNVPGAAASTSGEQSKGKDGAGAAKSTNKPLTIDPKLLERALLNRNQGR